MTAYSASLMLVKLGDGQPTESFNTIGGLQNAELEISHSYPENSTLESGKWRSMQTDAGFSQVGIAGEGLYTNSNAEASILQYALTNTPANYEFHFANGNIISGAFVITNYNRFGDVEGEESFNIVLVSSGEVAFAAG